MPFFWKKKKSIDSMLAEYFARCDNCFELFEKAFRTFIESGHTEAFRAAVQKTHEAESAADDMRREIELTLYGKALLPESRGDLLGLLETFDKLPNMAETVLFVVLCEELQIPEELKQDCVRLVEINIKSYYLVRKAVDTLLSNPRATLHATKEVDETESESDRLEREVIKKIFRRDDLSPGGKMLLKELVLLIGKISDRAETAADRIGIVAIKRQI
ncbi:MAG: TIGR00153 family protein [Deltaproteobacteria bacterium]|nr:MAG: TIGR00153 family protein [Deltaproteobacteria bacterium]